MDLNYVISAENDQLMQGTVARGLHAYVENTVVPALTVISADQYLDGPAAILTTAAPSCYVVRGDDVLWCVEWQPGLLVLRFEPSGRISVAAFTSPNPEFGRRQATKQELDQYDEDAWNPQYELVFDAWDAQFEQDSRALSGFGPIASDVNARYSLALAPVNELHASLERQFALDEGLRDKWMERCTRSALWRGQTLS